MQPFLVDAGHHAQLAALAQADPDAAGASIARQLRDSSINVTGLVLPCICNTARGWQNSILGIHACISSDSSMRSCNRHMPSPFI